MSEAGDSFERDCDILDELIRRAENYAKEKSDRPSMTRKALCSEVAEMLDMYDSRARNINGLLAIAIVKLIELDLVIAEEVGQLTDSETAVLNFIRR